MMDRMHKFVITCQNMIADEQAQDMVEYALVVALVALGAAATMRTFASSIGTAFGSIGTTLNSDI